MVIGHLKISSFRGISIGAIHWYARLHIEEGKEHKDIELKRKLSAKEIKILNQDGIRSYKIGDKTEGFDTKQDAIDFGIQTFKSHYKGILFLGDECSGSAWKDIILWPQTKRFNKIVLKMNNLAKEFQRLNGYEGDRTKTEKIDNKWYKLHQTIYKMVLLNEC